MPTQPIAETASGRVRGVYGEHAIAFRGIPYATAPRFSPPGVVPGWANVRDAAEPGPAAPQPSRDVATFTHGVPSATAEECLNLNVFTPSLSGAAPVLVWVHGGGFAIGHGSASLYEGSRLARAADAVVVTLNYRLGSLGWLSHPALAAVPGAPSGDWGLLDQIAALEWVRDNIAAFGGDPGRVTLAGQSAGALCAMDLLVSPGARGLFHRATLHSPPLVDVAQAPAIAARWAEALSAAAGGADGFDRARLMEVPAERIVVLHEEQLETPEFRGTRGGALPTIDAAVLPRSPAEDAGASPEVDVLIGSTAHEGTFFFGSPWRPPPPPERIAAIVGHLCHTDDPQSVLARYRTAADRRGDRTDDQGLLIEIATDAMVADPAQRWARSRAASVGAQDGKVYAYRFDHPGAGAGLGATHTAEVPLLFDTWRDGDAGERLGGQGDGTEPVAEAVVRAWTSFIHGGSPGWEPVPASPEASDLGVFGGELAFRIEHGRAANETPTCVP